MKTARKTIGMRKSGIAAAMALAFAVSLGLGGCGGGENAGNMTSFSANATKS